MPNNDSFYKDLVKTVIMTLDQFGKTFTLYKPGVYNADTLSSDAPAPVPVVGVLTSVKDVVGLIQGADTIQQVGRNKALIIEPVDGLARDWQVEVDGKRYNCTTLETVKPANIVVCHILILEQ